MKWPKPLTQRLGFRMSPAEPDNGDQDHLPGPAGGVSSRVPPAPQASHPQHSTAQGWYFLLLCEPILCGKKKEKDRKEGENVIIGLSFVFIAGHRWH